VNLVRLAGAHPSAALGRANTKFARRFAGVEALARERGVVMESTPLKELDLLWDEVKRRERAGGHPVTRPLRRSSWGGSVGRYTSTAPHPFSHTTGMHPKLTAAE
jgi:hypothetical protein